MSTITTYGPGGFDPGKPDGNVASVEEVETPEQPPTIEVVAEQVAALTDAVDTLILDSLGGFDV